mgnify:CR=1 FL=1
MAQSFPDFALTDEWQDITAVAGYEAAAGKQVTVQYKGGYQAYVYFGGAGVPAAGAGGLLMPGGSVTGTADHIWVRGTLSGAVYIQIED